jgi:hypothetical protein
MRMGRDRLSSNLGGEPVSRCRARWLGSNPLPTPRCRNTRRALRRRQIRAARCGLVAIRVLSAQQVCEGPQGGDGRGSLLSTPVLSNLVTLGSPTAA